MTSGSGVRRRAVALVAVLVAVLVMGGCSGAEIPPPAARSSSATVVAVGDIASCASSDDGRTAGLVPDSAEAVLTLGDTVYDRGTAVEFRSCFVPSWGRLTPRIHPAPGNHDYATKGASAYFDYFGDAAGDPRTGYYSFDVGAWHLVALNSSCAEVSCAAGGAQDRFLREDLRLHAARCTLAYWHHARFSSGSVHGDDPAMSSIWRTFADGGGDVVLAGHEHSYERFGRLTSTGVADTEHGVASFVVGTGGRSLYELGPRARGSEAAIDDAFGVLVLSLRPADFSWRFLTVDGAVADSGTARCR